MLDFSGNKSRSKEARVGNTFQITRMIREILESTGKGVRHH